MLFYAKTDPGRVRGHNEDHVFASDAVVGGCPNLFVVADGMGGHNAGEHASEMAVKTVVSTLREHKNVNVHEALAASIRAAKENVAMQGMGTTLVAAVIEPGEMTVSNIGDSRLYIVRDGELIRVTNDHSLIEEMIRAGKLSRSQSVYHPDKNKITRAIGAESAVRPDFFEISMEGVTNVLLCTDGLTNMVEEDEIREILTSDRKVKQQAEELLRRANENGGLDNITVLVIDPVTD